MGRLVDGPSDGLADQISNLQVDKETHLHRTLNSYWTWCSAIFLGGGGGGNSPWTISLISYTAYVGEYLLYLRYLEIFDDYVNYVFGICCDNMATHSPMAAMFFLTSARSFSLDARNFWILPRVTSSTNSQWFFLDSCDKAVADVLHPWKINKHVCGNPFMSPFDQMINVKIHIIYV